MVQGTVRDRPQDGVARENPDNPNLSRYNEGNRDSEEEAKNFIIYLKTKFFRSLVLSIKISQHAPSKTYRFVPMQDFTKPWTDAELYKKYSLTDEEIAFIESMIKPM